MTMLRNCTVLTICVCLIIGRSSGNNSCNIFKITSLHITADVNKEPCTTSTVTTQPSTCPGVTDAPYTYTAGVVSGELCEVIGSLCLNRKITIYATITSSTNIVKLMGGNNEQFAMISILSSGAKMRIVDAASAMAFRATPSGMFTVNKPLVMTFEPKAANVEVKVDGTALVTLPYTGAFSDVTKLIGVKKLCSTFQITNIVVGLD